MITVQAHKDTNPVTLEPFYMFTDADEDGNTWDLGGASIDRDGIEYDGYLDTKHVAFDNLDQLRAWGKRHGYRIEEA